MTDEQVDKLGDRMAMQLQRNADTRHGGADPVMKMMEEKLGKMVQHTNTTMNEVKQQTVKALEQMPQEVAAKTCVEVKLAVKEQIHVECSDGGGGLLHCWPSHSR